MAKYDNTSADAPEPQIMADAAYIILCANAGIHGSFLRGPMMSCAVRAQTGPVTLS